MQRRRPLLLAAGAAALAALPPLARPALAQMDLGRATAFIQQTGDQMVAAINAPGSPAERRERVAAIVRRAVDVEGVGRFVLGRHWRTATPQEQAEYLRLFEEVLVRNLSARFGEFQGVRFALGRSQQRTEDDALVTTVVERPGSPPVNLDWRVAETASGPRVVDLVAEGTSLRLTQRSEYSAVVTRNGGRVAPLLDAMRGQVSGLTAREGR